jgi:hypothetical protein
LNRPDGKLHGIYAPLQREARETHREIAPSRKLGTPVAIGCHFLLVGT